MEKVAFIRKVENIEKVINDYNRIYFGEEFCENRLQSTAEFKKAQDIARENKKSITFVFPFLTDEGIKELDEIFDAIDVNIEGFEVVANDWGTLYHLRKKYPDMNIITGRLLNKTKRDPRIKTAEEFLEKETYEIFKSSNLLTKSSLKLLASNKIKAIEFDYPMQGINLKKSDLLYYVHFPLGYITTARYCISNPAVYNPGRSYKCTAKLCEKITLKEENDTFSTRVYQKGNTVFYYNSSITKEELFEMGFDRVIEHNGL